MRVSGRWAGLALLAALMPARAWAGQVEDDVQQALKLINDGDFEGARARLELAEAHAVESSSVVLGRSLASVHFYRGVLEYYDGDRNKRTLDHWRLTLVADITFTFDTSLVADQEPRDLFEALRTEVRSRPHYEPGLREDREEVRVFVDGRMLRSHELIVGGRHLVQVSCPDLPLKSYWHSFGEPPDYYAACEVEPEPLATVDPGDPPPEDPTPTPTPTGPRDGPPIAKLALLGGGGALVAGGLTANFVWVNPAWNRVDAARQDPASVTRSAADDLTRQFNTARFTTLGLLGAGAACVGVGLLVDDDLAFVPTPGGGVFVGRF